jgi:transposase InsO family protein
MPWKETGPVDQRVQFIATYLAGAQTLKAAAAQFGVSRKTAYKRLNRYRQDGPAGLDPRPPIPHQRPHALSPAVRGAILAAHDRQPTWGPKKLRTLLADQPDVPRVPAASAIGRVLAAAGKTHSRPRSTHAAATPTPLTTPTGPNHVWTTDFKGWFRTGDGRKCFPLTVLDSASRYVLAGEALPDTHGTTVRPVFEGLFATYGLPAIIRSDNGTPFASTGFGGLTALNVWWRRLGIRLERIAPGHPEQNGRHERFHRTLKAEVSIAADCAAQQQLFDAFVVAFNTERPHEALGFRTPAAVYVGSARPYPAVLPAPRATPGAIARQVRHNGSVLFAGKEVYVTPALTGETIEFVAFAGSVWWVVFAGELLGWCETTTGRVRGMTQQKQDAREAIVHGRPVTL